MSSLGGLNESGNVSTSIDLDEESSTDRSSLNEKLISGDQESKGEIKKKRFSFKNKLKINIKATGKVKTKKQKAKNLKKSRNDNSALFEKYTDCTICLEAFKSGQKVKIIPGCQHLFHEKCCIQWLDYKMSCPNCNQPIEVEPIGGRNDSQSSQ